MLTQVYAKGKVKKFGQIELISGFNFSSHRRENMAKLKREENFCPKLESRTSIRQQHLIYHYQTKDIDLENIFIPQDEILVNKATIATM